MSNRLTTPMSERGKHLSKAADSTGPACLAADVGGTNVRFGLVSGAQDEHKTPRITRQMIYRCSSFDSIDLAMETYREHIGQPLPELACMAVAGPVNGNFVQMTNRNWIISGSELRHRFGFEEVAILNDAAAIAYATTVIDDSELEMIKPGRSVDGAPSAIITAGTGLGVAALVHFNRSWHPLSSEAGHSSLAPKTAIEVAVFDALKADVEHISAELLLSGRGIRNLYHALASVAGLVVNDASPEIIVRRALDRTDTLSSETLDIYCNLLGDFAGDIALSFGARGGIYLAGNVLRQVEPLLLASTSFLNRFAHKGAMTDLVSNIPVNLITTAEPGLVGAYAWLDHSVTKRIPARQ